MKAVVQRLLAIVRRRQVKVRFLLLDKGFFSVEVISYLKRAKVGFIIPAMVRGRKPKGRNKATGLRALRKKKNGYYKHTLTGKVGEQQRSTRVTICVASKYYTEKKTGKRRRKKLLYVIWKVRVTPREIRETYRTRFGIETSYRQMNKARIKTCTRDPRLRLLFVGIALVLRNVWVWLHFKLARGCHGAVRRSPVRDRPTVTVRGGCVTESKRPAWAFGALHRDDTDLGPRHRARVEVARLEFCGELDAGMPCGGETLSRLWSARGWRPAGSGRRDQNLVRQFAHASELGGSVGQTRRVLPAKSEGGDLSTFP